MVRENCGVVGIFARGEGDNVVPMAIDALRALQHRGQEAWGIAVPGKAPVRRLGLVSAAAAEFEEISEHFASSAAIGHVRYSTVGRSSLENAQPLKVADLCVAHNGTIANAPELAEMAGGCTFTPQTASDTLVAAQRLVALMSRGRNLSSALSVLKDEMVGSYCFAFLAGDGAVYAARDPRGFRPMVMGSKDGGRVWIVASESAALSAVGASLERDVRPGEIVRLSASGLESEAFADGMAPAHCSFEFTYFAHPTSTMEGKSVYLARKAIGAHLAKKFPLRDADLVIPVPDSARPAALGYAQELGIPFDEGLIKDRYSKKGPLRSFIEPHQDDRVEINRWIIPIRQIVEGRHVVVIDDSLVRGTSSRALVGALRDAGARRISMLITYPPIRHPCYAGIDFPSRDELAAHSGVPDQSLEGVTEMVRADIGADFLGYNDAENLARAVGMDASSMCFTCHTGDYGPLGVTPEFRSREDLKGK
ncbi:MAG: amidophosphoribosyltransferase [Thaumarchaeota archaeon]|nr:amidophosphoribosyltransferase [Nitrososphaerota archaeon]